MMFRITGTQAEEPNAFLQSYRAMRRRDLRAPTALAIGLIAALVLLAFYGNHTALVILMIIALVVYVIGCWKVEIAIDRQEMLTRYENHKHYESYRGALFLGSWVTLLVIQLYKRRKR